MTILENLQNQMKEAMRSKSQERLSVIRMLITEIRNEEKLKTNKRSQEDIVLAYHKKLKKSIDQFPAEKHPPILSEMKIVEEFMPKQMTKEEVVDYIKNNFSDTDVNMKNVMPHLKGKTDGKLVSEIVNNWKK